MGLGPNDWANGLQLQWAAWPKTQWNLSGTLYTISCLPDLRGTLAQLWSLLTALSNP